jgi:UDP-arabinose 4-epimerase
MQRVLVTGGAGYVGSHTCKALADHGYVPVTVDDFSSGHRGAVRWGPLERGDIADRAFMERVLAEHRPVAVLHFAAFSQVGESVREPARYYANNVAGTLALLEAIRSDGPRKIVFSSTCATYGQPERLPIKESDPQAPINPYGRSKLAVEHLLHDCCVAYGIRAVALRYFNAAGAEAEAGIGEAHEPETHLIPLVIETALARRGPVEIFGDDYPTPDGTCQRDYVHVGDLAEAHVLALRFLDWSPGFHAFNLGTGRAYSVREVIAAAERVGRRSIPVRVAARRPGDPPVLFADASGAEATLGWSPQRSSIDEIVRSAWAWHASELRFAG